MDLIPWQPMRELERLRHQFDRLLAEPLLGIGSHLPVPFPAEVVERDDEVVLRCEVAGIEPENLDVWITDEGVTIRGERKAEQEQHRRGAYRSERYYGTFSRSIAFPVPVESQQATATFRHGVLEIRAPKRTPESGRGGRRLPINTEH
ncbi:MAG TPA: Hsp20/alpha crystallin family protein [Symbiobacteriaceae bacterium]